ncbi:hypothetical protein BJ508DRAFT_305488 [Ascobolus immersus RN42]|uniref:Ecp2 effector protein domain-containing protein n=1 Tax=Ascobolus immersus RN42 TaxID=1160509 RepID=A0A3N4I953_ASCIM|nr:hypothetical protein BJ508DRAFT_305488 [Ascobolus immersus RN42]
MVHLLPALSTLHLLLFLFLTTTTLALPSNDVVERHTGFSEAKFDELLRTVGYAGESYILTSNPTARSKMSCEEYLSTTSPPSDPISSMDYDFPKDAPCRIIPAPQKSSPEGSLIDTSPVDSSLTLTSADDDEMTARFYCHTRRFPRSPRADHVFDLQQYLRRIGGYGVKCLDTNTNGYCTNMKKINTSGVSYCRKKGDTPNKGHNCRLQGWLTYWIYRKCYRQLGDPDFAFAEGFARMFKPEPAGIVAVHRRDKVNSMLFSENLSNGSFYDTDGNIWLCNRS